MSSIIARDQLLSIIERVERVQDEIDALNDDKKEIYAEAKGNGFEVWAIKKIVKERADLAKTDPAKIEERDAILDTYKLALGMIDAPRAHTQVHAHEPSELQTGASTSAFTSPTGSGPEEIPAPIPPPPAILPCKADSTQGKNAPDPEAQKTERANAPLAEAATDAGTTDGKSGEAVVSSQTQPEARMPRASSPAVKTGKGGKLPVPGPEQNRFAKTQHGGTSGEIDLTIPPFLRRERTNTATADESKTTEATV